MYFNHAFRKSFLGKDVEGDLSVATTGSTADLAAGQLGLFDASTYQAVTSTGKPFILAQGSYYTNDKIGPYHGGYTESVKSKVINPKYISRVFTTCAVEPANHVVAVGWDLDGGSGFQFECGKTYRLRIDLKGSPALRFLSHNIYNTVDVFSGCCADDCSAACTGDPVDAACVLLGWKDRIMTNPILSQFILPKVFVQDGTDAIEVFSALDVEMGRDEGEGEYTCVTGAGAGDVVAGLVLEAAYEDTKFGQCTFTPRDHYELQPLKILVSVVDETGEPCAIKPVGNSATGDVSSVDSDLVTTVQEPAQAQGVGETVIRDLILSGRYRQEAFPDSMNVNHLRMREIESNPALIGAEGYAIRTGLYNTINILHSVPRFNNPSGTFDNDQYLLTIYVPTGVSASTFLDSLQEILNCAGNGLEIENFDGGRPCPDMDFGIDAGDGCLNPVSVETTTTTTAAPIL
jgi:hypothetical protein